MAATTTTAQTDTAAEADSDTHADTGVDTGRRAAHEATIRRIYEAFGRGDIPAILARLTDDVSWDADWKDQSAHREPAVPHLAPRRGRAGVAEFFTLIGGYTFHDFAVLGLLSGDDAVAARIRVAFTMPGGGTVEDEEIHLWVLDEHGLVRAFRHYSDTAKHRAGISATG
ncbi:nuclear transport factor 2 family protein [Frankia sp. CNm7]|uniref:Nuclear transport factor 2 family protein n=1 Tax=Frankia nepalensis TaxID=1836974 RepID=A0A937RI55_9ACTN|nr:nuclear transport factor 2 family protein [Frankia nepalensis]MBL7497372.1 nuclear transport factor 2 family protein [Frankia nepalensis]MBL7512762.1 nuclear transport factor 2 family protein [Frankia nepalensis]MBL7518102.1 nuclear transport factor 2 family protein [Frankia nepalensis]MBL7629410.1 nuclear transport factor 2 family protein [Frankia nepalensis]